MNGRRRSITGAWLARPGRRLKSRLWACGRSSASADDALLTGSC